MKACALQAESDFEQSVLARVMAERGTEDLPPGGAQMPSVELPDFFGTPEPRRATHQIIFGDQRPSRAVDLARLDFAVALQNVLNILSEGIAAELVPRDERVVRCADAVATAAAKHLLEHGIHGFDSKKVFAPFRAPLDALYAGAPARIQDDLAHNVDVTLHNHVQGLCAECPAKCFANQKRGYRDVIETPMHPVAVALIKRMR